MSKDKSSAGFGVSLRPDFFEDFANTVEIVFWVADPETYQLVYVSQCAAKVLGVPLSVWQRPSLGRSFIFRG